MRIYGDELKHLGIDQNLRSFSFRVPDSSKHREKTPVKVIPFAILPISPLPRGSHVLIAATAKMPTKNIIVGLR